MSPTIMQDGTYSYIFRARDIDHHPHDPHIHVGKTARATPNSGWPVELRYSRGIPTHETTKIEKTVIEHEAFFLEKWQEFFGEF